MIPFYRSIILFILSILCFCLLQSCKEKIDPDKVSLLKQTIDFMEEQNTGAMFKIKENIRDQGNRPDNLNAYNELNALLMRQQDTILEKSNYLHTLVPEYRKSEKYDSMLVHNTENFYSAFLKKDSIAWYYYKIGLLTMEREVINTTAMRISSTCFRPLKYVNVFTSSDSLKCNQDYTLIITAVDDYLDHSDRFSIHLNNSACIITCNGKPVSLPLNIEQLGQTFTIRFTPKEPGTYKIEGDVVIKFSLYSFTATNHFTKTVYIQ